MKAVVLLFITLTAFTVAVPCTDPSTEAPPTSPAQTTPPTTTEYVPPPRAFPQGTYALPKASVGCPYSSGFWTWWRYQDTEDYYNGNQWPSTGVGMHSILKRDGYQLFYCLKTNATKGAAYDWPAGDYCIIKKGDCPTGFDSGSITWDDEDRFNANRRKRGGPDGTFTSDTTMEYCCRNDGSATTPVKLPIRRAFYLMRYTGECQQVAEMNVTEEVIFWDDEDNRNRNSASGAHPMDTGNAANHKLHYCYYEPIVTPVEA